MYSQKLDIVLTFNMISTKNQSLTVDWGIIATINAKQL